MDQKKGVAVQAAAQGVSDAQHHADIVDVAKVMAGSIDELADVIGFEAAFNLHEAYRGFDWIYVPHQIDAGHAISRTVGIDAARRIVEYFAGSRLPVLNYNHRQVRIHLLREDVLKNTLSNQELAVKHRVGARWIRAVRRKLNQGEPTPKYVAVAKPTPSTRLTAALAGRIAIALAGRPAISAEEASQIAVELGLDVGRVYTRARSMKIRVPDDVSTDKIRKSPNPSLADDSYFVGTSRNI